MSKARPATPPKPGAKYAPIPDICATYGFGRSTAYRLLDCGKIRATKVGKRRLIEIASVEELMATDNCGGL